MTTPGYYRFPTIHGDRVVFVCEDDLWQVPWGGGVAVRLTAGLGAVSHPAFSPDGEQLAFVGREDGQAEVYVMPAAGGRAQRLTFLGDGAQVVGWSPDGQFILFASDAGQPFRGLMQLHRISPDGGLPQRLPYGMAHTVSYGPDGGVLLGRNIGDPARWKRYRGGLAGVMWIDRAGSGQFEPLEPLPDGTGNLAAPLWIGDRIYFISDHEGIGNLYSCTPTGTGLQRLTHQQEYYLRNATTDGQRIVYHAGADLGYFDVATGESHPIMVQFYSPRVQQQRKFVDAGQYLETYGLHPRGDATLVTSRGQSATFGHWEGAVTPLKPNPGDRYRLTQWLHGGTQLVTVRVTGEDANPGAEQLMRLDTTLGAEAKVLSNLDLGRIVDLRVSPVANQVVLANQRHELIWVDLDSGESKVLDRSAYQRIHGMDWSPDGNWVAYGCSETQFTASIKICSVTTGDVHRLTPPRFLDFNPSFDPEGKFLYFLSIRDLNPVYDSVYFDLGFPRATRPFLLSLQQDTLSPFIPIPKPISEDDKDDDKNNHDSSSEAKDEASSEGSEEGAEDGDEHQTSPAAMTIDFSGIEQRIARFPVSEGRYQEIRGVKSGALFSSAPLRGSIGEWHDDPLAAEMKLELYDFKTQECELVSKAVSDFEVGWDYSTLIYRSGDRLRVCLAKAQDDDGEDDEPSRKTGWLDLDRVRFAVEPLAEWGQMLAEIWALQRDHFWTEDLSGVDWRRVYHRYQPLLARVGTRSEFSDLVWEMQGELGTSHAYEIGGDYRQPPDYALGVLGADFAQDESGYRIAHIVQGDAWSQQGSPLQAMGANVQEGDRLLAINGQRLTPTQSPHEFLVHQAGCWVDLTVARDQPNGDGEPRRVSVKALGSDRAARYREWVEANHRAVTDATEGRVGYLHIPDMGPEGYAEFHRYYFAEVHKQGLVVDVRFNGGGHVSQLILEKLARERIGYDVPRWEQPEPYPSDSMAGPIVAITNEQAGSDGDIFSHCFKLMNLGELVGTRTWGGVIGIWPRHQLVDHSVVTQPEYSFWFKDVGWQVENYGTDPTIPVVIPPQDRAAGTPSRPTSGSTRPG